MDQKKRVISTLLPAIGLATVATFGAWQFYQFATFKDSQGVVDVQGGIVHLWLAIGAALVACLGGFFLLSRILSYDQRNEIHIASQGHPLGVGRSIRDSL